MDRIYSRTPPINEDVKKIIKIIKSRDDYKTKEIPPNQLNLILNFSIDSSILVMFDNSINLTEYYKIGNDYGVNIELRDTTNTLATILDHLQQRPDEKLLNFFSEYLKNISNIFINNEYYHEKNIETILKCRTILSMLDGTLKKKILEKLDDLQNLIIDLSYEFYDVPELKLIFTLLKKRKEI